MTPLVAAILAPAINTAQFAEWVIEGRVVAISDGGTITLLDGDKTQRRIRLVGIDAPERKQPFSDKSKVNISRLVFDKSVEAHCHKRDRYGREVCKIMRGATDVNLEQLRTGMAW